MANDGRWEFQSIVIVLSTLNIINVKAEVNDRNLGTFPPLYSLCIDGCTKGTLSLISSVWGALSIEFIVKGNIHDIPEVILWGLSEISLL